MQKLLKSNIGIIYIVLCILLWALIPSFAKFVQSGLDHYQYLFYSSIISFLSIFIVSLFERNLKEVLSYSKKIFLILFGLGFLDFIFYLFLYFGYKHANGLEVLVIQYMWPIFIVFLSLIILKEDFTKRKLFSIIFGFFGVSLVITKGDFASLDFSQIDVLLVVMSGTIAFALFSVLSKKVTINPTNAVMIYFFSAIIYSTITVETYSSFILPSGKDWIIILINGALINGISYLFWIKGLQIFDASKVAPFIFITPILSAFFLILFFNETILPIYFLGLFFVILSGLINSLKKKHK
ncbi:EamA/RhaT family transporter [Arcobacter venerupis]|uniref:EamA/RhaT family transporter n=1 Tax=Arcobacter venerupis TaxID=1054033 RepID=A0AAE7B914_9BACT|nr:DMT family transporter [Arcobacter venerupis]QKF65930.1 EamA/RhaT family transporter [Arcobacter venerupis]RWS49290.1 permease [Arcobacter venerupis]